MNTRQSGVTLMELMVVMTIVGILAAIAYPNYRDQVRRSNRTEAKIALEQTAAALEKCFTRYMTYADFTNCPAANQFQSGGGFTTPNGNYRVTGAFDASGMEYDLTATPLAGQLSDSQCMNFKLDERGVRAVSTSTPAATCW